MSYNSGGSDNDDDDDGDFFLIVVWYENVTYNSSKTAFDL